MTNTEALVSCAIHEARSGRPIPTLPNTKAVRDAIRGRATYFSRAEAFASLHACVDVALSLATPAPKTPRGR